MKIFVVRPLLSAFGIAGNPRYLGATTPIINAAVQRLNLSPDGKSLTADTLFYDEPISGGTMSRKGLLRWDNVPALIQHAIDNANAGKINKPFDLNLTAIQPQKIVETALPASQGGGNTPIGWINGIASRNTTNVTIDMPARYGDIFKVDLLSIIAKQPGPLQGITEAEILKYTDINSSGQGQIVKDGTKILSRQVATGDDAFVKIPGSANNYDYVTRKVTETEAAEVSETGIFYIAPTLDMEALRNGQRLNDGTVAISFTVWARGDKFQYTLNLKLTDFDSAAGRVFFGDRALDNPGYTAFTLQGEIKADSKANKPLDVWRVEQRLKYLGFPAMGSDTNGTPTLANNTLQDFKVDGVWERDESLAAYLFSNVISYTNGQRQLATPGARVNPHPGQSWAGFGDTYSNRSAYFTTLYDTAKSFSIEQNGSFKYRAPDGTSAGTIVEWTSNPGDFTNYLNAYNAPHWMNVYQSLQGVQGLTVTSGMTPAIGTKPSREEMYGVSWARDLMVASAYADTNLQPGSIRFNGMVDANHGYTPFGHATHDLGMAFDLGVKDYITKATPNFGQNDPHDSVTPQVAAALAAVPTTRGAWSLANAVDYSSWLPNETNADNLNDQVTALRNFLSLYSVTQSDGWNAMTSHFVNGTQARDALFGSGKQDSDQLISKVVIGGTGSQNPYTNMRNVLNALGVGLDKQVKDHNSHFHVFLNTLAPVSFQNLLADNLSATQPGAATPATLQTEAQGLLDYAQTLTNTGDELMFTMDVPYIPAQETPIVLAQAATPGTTTPQPGYLLTSCQQTESTGNPRSADRAVDPAGLLEGYLGFRDHRPFSFENAASIKPILLEATTLGTITSGGVSNYGRTTYHYTPIPNSTGNDRAVFLAEFEGKVYKIIVNIVVSPTVGESPLMEGEEPVCPPPKLIKVNGKPVSGSLGIDLNNISVSITDLPDAAIGQTVGTTITLDTNAANYNWFIDTTPSLNEEFLPTSNPNEWVAKAGSAAAGKMDMLSVLLHEYGHALGINHSADPNDYMGTTLTAGVRRLPTADELALMQNLISQAKTQMTATSSTPGNAPTFPTLPLGTSFIGFLGLLRSSRYGGLGIAPDVNTLVTQYDWAANATLTNGNLNAPDGWSTQGSVNIANGAAVMNEVTNSQTRLSQVFLLNPTDRFLSFTLSGTALDDLNGAPDDAFEVALLNANTGATLLGSDGRDLRVSVTIVFQSCTQIETLSVPESICF